MEQSLLDDDAPPSLFRDRGQSLIDEDGTGPAVPLRSSAADDGPSLRLSTRLSSRAAAGDVGKSGTCGAVMNLSNTVLGAGVLAMPFACAQCGLTLFFVLLTAVAVGAHLSIRLLAISMDKHHLTSTARYASLGHAAYSRLGASAAMLAIGLQQLGPCIIYIQCVNPQPPTPPPRRPPTLSVTTGLR